MSLVSVAMTAGLAGITFYLAQRFKNETKNKIFNPWLWSVLAIFIGLFSTAIMFYKRYNIDKQKKYLAGTIASVIGGILMIAPLIWLMWVFSSHPY